MLKKSIFILCLVLSAFIAFLSYFLFIYLPGQNNQNIDLLSSKITQTVKNDQFFSNNPVVRKDVEVLNNPSFSLDDRYKALSAILFYLRDEYSYNNSPSTRNYIQSIAPLAEKAFPKQYQDFDFSVNCADPQCGMKPDPEISKIMTDIKNLNVDPKYKDAISINLKNGAYIPFDTDEDRSDKIGLLGLVYQQLTSLNNSNASASANELKSYTKEKFSQIL